MKKILFLLFSAIFISNLVFAQGEYTDYNELLNSTTMPSDAEIMNIINKFDFTPEQKHQLFKETKKQIEEMYRTKNAAMMEQAVNLGQQTLQNANLTPDDFLPNVEKIDKNTQTVESSEKRSPQKYGKRLNDRGFRDY